MSIFNFIAIFYILIKTHIESLLESDLFKLISDDDIAKISSFSLSDNSLSLSYSIQSSRSVNKTGSEF